MKLNQTDDRARHEQQQQQLARLRAIPRHLISDVLKAAMATIHAQAKELPAAALPAGATNDDLQAAVAYIRSNAGAILAARRRRWMDRLQSFPAGATNDDLQATVSRIFSRAQERLRGARGSA